MSESSLRKRLSDENLLLFYGFCGVFFLLPITTSPPIILGITTLCVWFFSGQFIRERRRWMKQDWILPVVIFMLLPWAGMLWTKDVPTGLEFAEKSYYWLYAFAIASVSFNGRQHVLMKSYIAGLSFNVALAALQFARLAPMPRGYATGLFSGGSPYITYSLLLVFGMLLLSRYYKQAASNKQRFMLIMGMLAFFFNIIIIPGRIGYIAFVVMLPLALNNIFGKKGIWKAVATFAVLVAVLVSSPTVRERTKLVADNIDSYSQGIVKTSVGVRLYMWKGAVKIFLQNPVLGVGTGGYQKAMAEIKENPNDPEPGDPHNSLLYIASSYGMMGLACFFWLLAIYFRKGWRHRDTMVGYSMLAFGLVLLIGSLTGTQINSMATGYLFALFMGLPAETSN